MQILWDHGENYENGLKPTKGFYSFVSCETLNFAWTKIELCISDMHEMFAMQSTDFVSIAIVLKHYDEAMEGRQLRQKMFESYNPSQLSAKVEKITFAFCTNPGILLNYTLIYSIEIQCGLIMGQLKSTRLIEGISKLITALCLWTNNINAYFDNNIYLHFFP